MIPGNSTPFHVYILCTRPFNWCFVNVKAYAPVYTCGYMFNKVFLGYVRGYVKIVCRDIECDGVRHQWPFSLTRFRASNPLRWKLPWFVLKRLDPLDIQVSSKSVISLDIDDFTHFVITIGSYGYLGKRIVIFEIILNILTRIISFPIFGWTATKIYYIRFRKQFLWSRLY